MRRHELSDEEWAIIQPLLPNKPRGMPRVDDRRVLNGILWRFRTGAPCRAGGVQNSCSRNTPMICASVNLLFFMSVSLDDGLSLKSRDQEGGRSVRPCGAQASAMAIRSIWKAYGKRMGPWSELRGRRGRRGSARRRTDAYPARDRFAVAKAWN